MGFAAGGATDAAARIIAKKLRENLGQTVVVENRAGAGGNIAHQQVATAADGTILLLGSIGPLTIAPHLMKLPYDPLKDLAPLTIGVNFPNVLVVHTGVGVKTLAEFVALAKTKPGAVDFASTGAGSASHLAGELFNQRAGDRHRPRALQRWRAGPAGPAGRPRRRVLLDAAHGAPHIEAGKLSRWPPRADASGLHAQRPDDRGIWLPRLRGANWYAFVAPGKTPTPILDRWNVEIVKVMNSPT